MSEIFLIIISGVFIFAAQKIISDIWIVNNIEFQKSLARIEVLIIKANGMYTWTYGNNNLKSSKGTSMDEEIREVRKELNLATWGLLERYNSLFFLEKYMLKIRSIQINNAIPRLLSLSVLICAKDDWKTGASKAKEKITEVATCLKFKDDFLK